MLAALLPDYLRVIPVQNDASGQVRAAQTGDHLDRKGLGWAGGVALYECVTDRK